MESIPKPGEFYRHFKNKLYQIVAVAVHSETGEQMVVYQALYGDFGVYVRPLNLFMGETDLEKYPDAVQKDRFVKVEPGKEEMENREQNKEKDPNPLFMKFLDADDLEERIGLLEQMRGKIGKREADSLCLVLDVQMQREDPNEQLELLISNLKMQQRYDASRLRRR